MKIKREQYHEGIIVHFYNRVVPNELLFRENKDYTQFLKPFKKSVKEIPSSVYAYCLMPNHFHFLLRQNSKIPLYKIFNKILSSYVQKYNIKYIRKGSIFGHPLQSKLVVDEEQLITLCKYIHLNPVKAGLVEEPDDWEFSNYQEWIGVRSGELFDDFILKKSFVDVADYVKSINEYKQQVLEKTLLELLDEA
ncbi:MAG: transposase [Candidatus Celaenobacter antarcticus]|nr:transposase [Candidatus Celaenobacter antarcticus]